METARELSTLQRHLLYKKYNFHKADLLIQHPNFP